MFTAIQARNVANEQYNHRYYKLYRSYCGSIMRGITRTAKSGQLNFSYGAADAKRMTMAVLRQIADELGVYGYKCVVSMDNTDDNKRKYGVIQISWAE